MSSHTKPYAPIATDNAPAAIGTYSQAVNTQAPVTTYLSGQIPLVPGAADLVSDNFNEQAEQVFKNLTAVAEAAGGSLDHCVKLNIYLTDLSHFASVNETMARFISEPYPARAAVQVSALPKGAQIEIDAIMVSGG
ncbi:MAG: Rid family detoxifying hydrolase [Pseudomonadota bacterium]